MGEAQRIPSAKYKVAVIAITHSSVPELPFPCLVWLTSLSLKLSLHCVFQESSLMLSSGLPLHPLHTSSIALTLTLCSCLPDLSSFICVLYQALNITSVIVE